MPFVVLPQLVRALVPQTVLDWLRHVVWRLPNLVRRLPSGLRVLVRSPSDWVLFNDIFVDREYEEVIGTLVRRTSASSEIHILDLGANVGYFSLYAADRLLVNDRTSFAVEMVEPNPLLVRELRQRVAAQQPLQDKLRVTQALVGERDGGAVLHAAGAHFQASAVRRASRGPSWFVRYIDIEKLAGSWSHVDLIKCDIEGSETTFLRTYPDLLAKCGLLAIELHVGCCDFASCHHMIVAAGLTQWRELRVTADATLRLYERSAV
jgi:FkbM family methyltransferase